MWWFGAAYTYLVIIAWHAKGGIHSIAFTQIAHTLSSLKYPMVKLDWATQGFRYNKYNIAHHAFIVS